MILLYRVHEFKSFGNPEFHKFITGSGVVKMLKYVKYVSIMILLCLHGYINSGFGAVKQFTINFRTESKAVGPNILLGEISQVVVKDPKLKKKLDRLVITKAAPPGEAREITRSLIKKRIRASGFNLHQIIFNGPNTMRVTTIQNKIIHLQLSDPIGAVFDLNFEPDYRTVPIHQSDLSKRT